MHIFSFRCSLDKWFKIVDSHTIALSQFIQIHIRDFETNLEGSISHFFAFHSFSYVFFFFSFFRTKYCEHSGLAHSKATAVSITPIFEVAPKFTFHHYIIVSLHSLFSFWKNYVIDNSIFIIWNLMQTRNKHSIKIIDEIHRRNST